MGFWRVDLTPREHERHRSLTEELALEIGPGSGQTLVFSFRGLERLVPQGAFENQRRTCHPPSIPKPLRVPEPGAGRLPSSGSDPALPGELGGSHSALQPRPFGQVQCPDLQGGVGLKTVLQKRKLIFSVSQNAIGLTEVPRGV